MTPLYDVVSAWPIIGHGKSQLAVEKAKLAMGVQGRWTHYRLNEITARHWQGLADRTGIEVLWERMHALVEYSTGAIDRLESRLPREFPQRIYASIRKGIRRQAKQFLAAASESR